jgi:Fic family protein
MKRPTQGRYLRVSGQGARFDAFIPSPLPPQPPIQWSPELRTRFDEALVAIGRLDSISDLVPNPGLLLHAFVRKEAVLSSMIEGTQSSLADLFLFEADETPDTPLDDVREVSRYVAALQHGVDRVREGFPISLRLIREVHEVLMGTRAPVTPGEFRRSQVWVGGTGPSDAAFVPPPAGELGGCLHALEQFLHDEQEVTPPLLRAALAHVQFETIHPFLDGNGRVGRLLIALQLAADGLLREPSLYLSLYFKQHRSEYYALLDGVRQAGDWEAWLRFFADAVCDSAASAASTARRLRQISERDAEQVATLGRATPSALAILRGFARTPIATATSLGAATELTPATVNKSLQHLVKLGIIEELTRRKRDRIFRYSAYAHVLDEGMSLPGAELQGTEVRYDLPTRPIAVREWGTKGYAAS